MAHCPRNELPFIFRPRRDCALKRKRMAETTIEFDEYYKIQTEFKLGIPHHPFRVFTTDRNIPSEGIFFLLDTENRQHRGYRQPKLV